MLAQLAHGRGPIPSIRVDTCEGLTVALERAVTDRGPHLIEAVVPTIFSEQQSAAGTVG